MSDCNHDLIKCMVCHRHVGIQDQKIPTAAAVAKILELENEIRDLKLQIRQMKSSGKMYSAIDHLIQTGRF